MARTPNGTITSVATALDSAKTISAITNASEAVVTSTAHGYSTGDIVLVYSGWGRLNFRAFRVRYVSADSFTLEGADTSNTTLFPPGGGVGSCKKVSTWVDLDRTMNHSSSGGDARTVTAKFIESENEVVLNDGFTAVQRTFEMDADAIGSPGYNALKTLSATGADTIVRRVARTGAITLLPATVSFNEEENLTEGQIVTVRGTFNAQNISTRYASSLGAPGFRVNVEEALRLNQQALGPELVSNGTFTDGTAGWSGQLGGTISSVDGELAVTGNGVQHARASTAVATIPGRTYVFLATLRIGTLSSGNVLLLASNNANLTSSFASQNIGKPSTNLRAATFFTATAETTYIGFGASLITSGTYFADNVSVREIDLSKCAIFQDSAGTLPVVSMEQPIGYIKDLSGNGNHFVQPDNTPSRPIVSRRVNLLTATETLETQNVTTLAASHVLAFSGTGSVTLSGTATGTYSAGTHTITTTAGTLTVTVSGSVTNADLRLAIDANLPPYQRVTSSTDYDEVGFPAYARFDGLDDWLESDVVDMTSTDEVTVIAGVAKLSDAATGVVIESSVNQPTNNGTFLVGAPSLIGGAKYKFISKGTTAAEADTTSTAFNAPHKALLTGSSKISSDTAILRVNGVQAASSSADQGTGNYGAYKVYMGRRYGGGGTIPFNGRLYGVTVIGKLLTDSQLAAAEHAERQLWRLY